MAGQAAAETAGPALAGALLCAMAAVANAARLPNNRPFIRETANTRMVGPLG